MRAGVALGRMQIHYIHIIIFVNSNVLMNRFLQFFNVCCVNLRASFMNNNFFLAFGDANNRQFYSALIPCLNRRRKLTLSAVNQQQIRTAPAFDISFAKPPKNHLVHISSVVVFFTHLKFAIFRTIARTIRKNYHTRHDLTSAHM